MRMARRSFLLLAFALLVSAFPPQSLAASDIKTPTERPAPKPRRQADWKPSQQQIFVSYWTLEPEWNTQLEVRNNLGWHDLDVRPVLRTAAGAEFELAQVTVAPDQVVTIDLRQAVAGVAPELLDKPESFGSVIYRFDALDPGNAFAANVVQRIGAPISFHFDGDDADESERLQKLEGIWWLRNDTATDYLILSNSSAKPIQVRATLGDLSNGKQTTTVALGPRQSARINIRELVGSASLKSEWGAISVLVLSKTASLSATEIVFDETTGFSALLKIFEQDGSQRSGPRTLRAPMMALSVPDSALAFPEGTQLKPQVFLRNTTSAPLPAAASVNWRTTDASGTFPVLSAPLSPGEARLLDIAAIQATGQIPTAANWATVTLKYQGTPGDLVAIASSFDSTGRASNPIFRVRERALERRHVACGRHPRFLHHRRQRSGSAAQRQDDAVLRCRESVLQYRKAACPRRADLD